MIDRHTHSLFGYAQHIIAIALITLMLTHPMVALGASSWNPALLVNTESFQIIDDQDTASDVFIQFGQTLDKKITFERSPDRFNFNDDAYISGNLDISGTASGKSLHGSLLVSSSGTIIAEGNILTHGNLSGATLAGAGLQDCKGTGNKITYDSATQKFKCESDQTGGGGDLSFDDAKTYFVDDGGDTMTGALIIDQNADSLSFDVDSEATTNAAVRIDIDGDSNSPHLLFGEGGTFDTNLFRQAANILRTDDSLYVSGTLSGAQLKLANLTTSGGILYNSGSTVQGTGKGTTGSILVSNATGAPEWKQSTASMVWFLDDIAEFGTSQGAHVTMPVGFTVTGIDLRATTPPTGASLIVDINENGTSLFSTNPEIDATATVEDGNEVLSDTILAAGSVITVDIDQVGSTFAGSGLTIMLNGVPRY